MKEVNDRHIIGERGVLDFHRYCNRHNPYILFRELSINDFGVDGEIEIVKVDSNQKKYATGEILKVQIKSTNSSKSYIRNENEKSFTYYASKDDVEYWSNFKFDLILIINDSRSDSLYAKSIPKINIRALKKKQESIPITFDKVNNRLTEGDNKFLDKFSTEFKTRVDFSRTEIIYTNACSFAKLPKLFYEYQTNFNNKKAIFEIITGDDAPYFAIYSNKIYTFYEIRKSNFPVFFSEILSNSKPITHTKKNVFDNKVLRNHYIENINLILKSTFRSKGIFYNRKYRRFYFTKDLDKTERTVNYKTRLHRNSKSKNVVSEHKYGKDEFFRHIAFETKYIYDDKDIYIIFNPKYLFTLDGKNTIAPKKITKYTNYKTAREFNNAVINQVHFVIDYIFNGNKTLNVINYENTNIEINGLKTLQADFSISGSYQPKANINSNPKTESLFE